MGRGWAGLLGSKNGLTGLPGIGSVVVRVGQLRRMTLHAHLDLSADPAMEGKRLVTPLAVLRFHHIPGGQAGVAIRAEVQRGVIHELPLLDRPPGLHPNAVGFARGKTRRQSRRKGVAIDAIA